LFQSAIATAHSGGKDEKSLLRHTPVLWIRPDQSSTELMSKSDP
jgi:hypothetical protein